MTVSHHFLQKLTVYRNLLRDPVVDKTAKLLKLLQEGKDEYRDEIEVLYNSMIHFILDKADNFELAADPWSNYVLNLIVEDENVFSLGCENKTLEMSSPVINLVNQDIEILKHLYNLNWSEISADLGADPYWWSLSWQPQYRPHPFYKNRVSEMMRIHQLFSARSHSRSILETLARFYRTVGCGQIGKFPGFHWDNGLCPVRYPDPIELDELLGIEEQKRLLITNTEIFLNGNKANNVLLYGEKGTGKSSSVKALLTRYAPRGLRMIELNKSDLGHLADINRSVRNRGFRFIIFVDDLSFEEFEVEYKHIKAAIEGSLEAKPDNVLLYVTSNRRHLVKETWRDRQSLDGEVHVSESHQEKLSLADRFGITIRYHVPNQEQYLNIVEHLARKNGLDIPLEDLRRMAVEWEMRYHGRSGRTAYQFITYLAGRAELAASKDDPSQRKVLQIKG